MFKMLKDAPGAPHGWDVKTYREGEVYPQPGFEETPDLLDAFLSAGDAIECDEAGEPLPADDPDAEPVAGAKKRKRKA